MFELRLTELMTMTPDRNMETFTLWENCKPASRAQFMRYFFLRYAEPFDLYPGYNIKVVF